MTKTLLNFPHKSFRRWSSVHPSVHLRHIDGWTAHHLRSVWFSESSEKFDHWSIMGEKKRKPQARLVTQLCLAHRPCWADPQAISASTTQLAPISSVYPAYPCNNWATSFLHAGLPNKIFLVLPCKPRYSNCTFGHRWGILEHWWLFNDTNLRVLIRELHRCGLWAYQCIFMTDLISVHNPWCSDSSLETRGRGYGYEKPYNWEFCIVKHKISNKVWA